MVESLSWLSVCYMCYTRAFRAFHTRDFFKMKKKKKNQRNGLRMPTMKHRNVVWVQQPHSATHNSFKSFILLHIRVMWVRGCHKCFLHISKTLCRHLKETWRHPLEPYSYMYAILRQTSRSELKSKRNLFLNCIACDFARRNTTTATLRNSYIPSTEIAISHLQFFISSCNWLNGTEYLTIHLSSAQLVWIELTIQFCPHHFESRAVLTESIGTDGEYND